MKLSVPKGEISLPEDFAFDIEQNNAFFSDDGAASLPATIPATPDNLSKLSYPTRIGRSTRFANIFDAILSVGPLQKKGALVVESASEEGITVAIGVEDSALYAKYRDTPLKDLFGRIVRNDYSTPAAWYTYLFSVYKQQVSDDFVLFPVGIGALDDYGNPEGLNNEPVIPDGWPLTRSGSSDIFNLAHSGRMIKEGGNDVRVPDGYGIAPFLKLRVFIEKLFYLCGYTIGANCFATDSILSGLVLLHNCSDVICPGRIDYADLVPDVTVGELLEWIRSKFLAQVIVHPEAAKVDIVLLDDILAGEAYENLSPKLIDSLTVTLERSKRIVLTSDTSIDGASPVAETLEAMKEQYGTVAQPNNTTAYGLHVDPATGNLSEVGVTLSKNVGDTYPIGRIYRKVGTMIVAYDRKNSEESVNYAPIDPVPPMMKVNGQWLAPYIGERIHRHTARIGEEASGKQSIIICDYGGLTVWTDTIDTGSCYFYGTTQPYNNAGGTRTGKIRLNAPGLFRKFFERYNDILLNNAPKIEGRFNLSPGEILSYNLYSLKLIQGQKALPVRLDYQAGKELRCSAAAFYLVKDFADSQHDEPFTMPYTTLTWQLNETQAVAAVAAVQTANPDKTIIGRYNDEYSSHNNTDQVPLYIGSPKTAGETSPHILRVLDIGYTEYASATGTTFHILETQEVEVWLTAVSLS